MTQRTLLTAKEVDITLHRLSCQLIERHQDFSNTVMIALQPRGVRVAERLKLLLEQFSIVDKVELGNLDTTFFRDDFRRRNEPLKANQTKIDFLVEGKNVIFVDDVLYTGRTVRAAMDAILSFGRPANAELLVLIDRRFSRHLPIEPTYTGRAVDSVASERVSVKWKESEGEDKVELISAPKS
ncbi:MAG: bifunctional pyr operon transcriptional regulator/uracil phosphoribosyltransferase PyrR [Flavobacteriales bacterium]|nr:bifunctional pyr operon transcriptional regulator/uracil phosphoribosyltransferase PyrR [Flavobacteriales bacterium]